MARRVDVAIKFWGTDFRERAEGLAAKCNRKITEVTAVEYREASPGTVVLQMSGTIAGRLLVGYNPVDWEVVQRLLASDHVPSHIEADHDRRSG